MKKIIILSGKARSGKDTVVELIKEFYQSERCMTLSYAYYLKDYLKRMGLFEEKEKPRKLMQEFGAFLKEKMGENFLIHRVLEDIRVLEDKYDIFIITDARLKPEIEILKQRFDQVITIRIERPNFDNGLSKEEKEDITETALDNYQHFDYVIQNDEHLKENLWRIL